jgi:hypothetical protein
LEQRFNYLKEMKETQLEKRYQELLQSSKEQAEGKVQLFFFEFPPPFFCLFL